MTAPEKSRVFEAHDTRAPSPSREDPLSRKIEDLAHQERDAVRRRDWSAARVAAKERASLQAVRQRAEAKRLA